MKTNQNLEEVSNFHLGRLESYEGFQSLPIVTPVGSDNLRGAFESHHELIRTELHRHGALLFRDWNVATANDFYDVIHALSDKAIDYVQRTSPRTEVISKVYTSTDYPPDQEIKPHNESSYASVWPLLISFFCLTEPEEGGETPITDNREMLTKLKSSTTARFEKKGISYTRNMLDWLGLSWQEVYQTDDKGKVEELLRNDGMDFQWVNDSHLRVIWQRPAFQVHPILNKRVWFNHAYFYHRLNQDSRLLDLVDKDELPFSVAFGDQTEIDEAIFQELKNAYEASTITFKWKKGDVLILDNMLFSHARRPFKGARKILVSMVDPLKYEFPAEILKA